MAEFLGNYLKSKSQFSGIGVVATAGDTVTLCLPNVNYPRDVKWTIQVILVNPATPSIDVNITLDAPDPQGAQLTGGIVNSFGRVIPDRWLNHVTLTASGFVELTSPYTGIQFVLTGTDARILVCSAGVGN